MDVEKTMQFLLAQQTRFDARQAEFAEQLSQSHERMTRIENVLLDVANAQALTNAILATLTERHVELAQSHKALSETQRVTEQNLNALISSVVRHITSHS